MAFNPTHFRPQKTSPGWEKFSRLPLPTPKDESWRYTNLDEWKETDWQPNQKQRQNQIMVDVLKHVVNKDWPVVVFVNGRLDLKISSLGEFKECISQDKTKNLELKTKNYFAQFARACSETSYLFIFPKGFSSEHPLQILQLASSDLPENTLLNLNLNFEFETEAMANLIFLNSRNPRQYCANSLCNFLIHPQAQLQITRLPDYQITNYNFESWDFDLRNKSKLDFYSLDTSSKLSRRVITTDLNGENISANFFGNYIGQTSEHFDNQLKIRHLQPNSESNQFYRGVLNETSKSIFTGKIYVDQIAQKTNTLQTNQSIVLSPNARSYSQPQLEIYADDVKCTHAATSGGLDPEQVFYLKSRGIKTGEAKKMLLRSFLSEAFQDQPKKIKQHIQSIITQRL